MDPATMEVKRSIPTPGSRPHGLFMREGEMWLGDTQMGKVHRLNPDDGDVLEEIDVPAPEVHGMTLHDDTIWFCCAVTRRVSTVPLPWRCGRESRALRREPHHTARHGRRPRRLDPMPQL